MNYIEYKLVNISEQMADIAVADLAETAFDSFSEYDAFEQSICCYILDSENQKQTPLIEALLAELNIEYHTKAIEQQNWNAVWESNFEPITVGEQCYIKAPFHESKGVTYEITIMPKMSFGTGHHATTHLMAEAILERDFSGMSGLDMGSGTGILAILASMRGAVLVDAVDIDEWAYENCIENLEMNSMQSSICPILGDVASIKGRVYDFVLANINRNILLRDMPEYIKTLREGGILVMSGILELDVEVISARAQELGMTIDNVALRDGWACVKTTKQ